jgi:hypothetical protein
MKKVEAGQDPMNTFRDPNAPPPEFHLEKDKAHFTYGFENLQYRQRRWSPFFCELCDLFAAYNEKRLRDALPTFALEHGAASTGE